MSASDTFRDVETGAAAATDQLADTFRENAAPPTRTGAAAAPKSNTKYFVAGTIGVLVIVAIAVAMSGGDDAQAASSSAVDVPVAPPSVDIQPSSSSSYDSEFDDAATTGLTDGAFAQVAADNAPSSSVEQGLAILSSDDVSSSDGSIDTNQFTPQVVVGDAAALALPEAVVATTGSPNEVTSAPTPSPSSSPTDSPSNEPTVVSSDAPSVSMGPTEHPTDSPSETPTEDPSASPSKRPTVGPSASPTDEPTKDPSESPTPSPSETPTKSPFGLSGWSFAAFGLEPTSTPSSKPTRRPTPNPTRFPTREPTPNPTRNPTASPITSAPTPYVPFFFGDDFYTDDDLGIEVSAGLSVRVIARVDEKVPYANGDESRLRYHTATDAAGIVPMNPSDPTGPDGYAYVVNSEEGDGNGGVYGIYFDAEGNVLEYRDLLTGTTDNCGGGHTPWNTWVSCEEYEDGQCWEVDPVDGTAEETKLGGRGGRYESVACDNTDPESPVFFTTEDAETGAMRRFVARGNGKGALQSDGDESFLNILDGGRYEWTTDLDEARESAAKFYRNSEGVQYHEGKLYFMAKKDYKMIVLDLEDMTYETEITGKKFYGEGSFGDQPDQNMFGPTRKYIYFTEDGGESPGVYARYGQSSEYFTLFQAIKGGVYDGDETVGIALSPDNRRFYAGIQLGVIFEFTRDDGLPFE